LSINEILYKDLRKYKRWAKFIIMKISHIILLFLSSSALGQDTLVYIRTPAFWVTETFYFIKSESSPKQGHFIKLMDSDDGQNWIGRGIFREDNKKIILDDFKLIRTQKFWHINTQGFYIVDSTKTDTSFIIKQILIKKKKALNLNIPFDKNKAKYISPPENNIRAYLNRLKLEN